MREVQDRRVAARWTRCSPALFRLLAALYCSLFLLLGLTYSSCTSRPVEETVTTDASRASALPPGAEPVAMSADLPERDENIEAAGDHIAAAITYLNTRQRDRREKALSALNQAEVVMNRALRTKPRNPQVHTTLRAALKDLDIAERAIQRGTTDTAAKQLAVVNKSLDNLDLHQTTDQLPPDADEAQ